MRLAPLMMTDDNILTMRFMGFGTKEIWSEQSKLASEKLGPAESEARQIALAMGGGEELLRRTWDYCFNDGVNLSRLGIAVAGNAVLDYTAPSQVILQKFMRYVSTLLSERCCF